MDHNDLVKQNRLAWESESYQAWVAAYGTPDQAAEKLVNDPSAKLKKILSHLGKINGQKIVNPLGSHGRVAVALALFGAYVTVYDLSATNQQYAKELAASAEVNIEYIVGDFLKNAGPQDEKFDSAVMELGVLHYFSDLDRFVSTLLTMLKPQATLVLNEFHPLLKKAIDFNNDGIELSGDYFSTEVEYANTPYDIFLGDSHVPQCLLRRWNLGEIVSAFVQNGFQLNRLIEEPAGMVAQLPGTFTLVATVA